MKPPDLSHLAQPGNTLSVRVTPRAARDGIELSSEGLKVRVTAPPEDGKANAAVQKLLAKALGLAKTRLTLVAGQSSRDKVFRID